MTADDKYSLLNRDNLTEPIQILLSYGELLTKDRSVTIHHKNIRALAIEIYKVMQGISPPLLNEVFVPRQCNYELRGNNFLEKRRVKGTLTRI